MVKSFYGTVCTADVSLDEIECILALCFPAFLLFLSNTAAVAFLCLQISALLEYQFMYLYVALNTFL